MVGDELSRMERGLGLLVQDLRTDPHALETVHVSVIAFAGLAKTIAPMTDLPAFYPPRLPLGGGTSLGRALELLMSEIDNKVVQTRPDKKGDWKPVVYLFTDGSPTDDYRSAVNKWLKSYSNKATMIVVALGQNAESPVLHEISDNVLIFKGDSEVDFKSFIDWVTASIVARSVSVGHGSEPADVSPQNSPVLSLAKPSDINTTDDHCITFLGRCNNTRKPYIIKYLKRPKNINLDMLKLDVGTYHFAGCYAIPDDYHAWTDETIAMPKVNTTMLNGAAGCPHCGGVTALALCGCEQIICYDGSSESVTCPWCETRVGFRPSGAGGMDITRGQG